jgi:hypothetical protein
MAAKQVAGRGYEQPEPQDQNEYRDGVGQKVGERGLS